MKSNNPSEKHFISYKMVYHKQNKMTMCMYVRFSISLSFDIYEILLGIPVYNGYMWPRT